MSIPEQKLYFIAVSPTQHNLKLSLPQSQPSAAGN